MADKIEQMKQDIIDRYTALSSEEKDVISSMIGTQELRVIGKVLGPEISSIANFANMSTRPKPKKRGLGTR